MVCVKEYHRANEIYSPGEFTRAVRNLKDKSLKVLLTEDDLSYVLEMFKDHGDEEVEVADEY